MDAADRCVVLVCGKRLSWNFSCWETERTASYYYSFHFFHTNINFTCLIGASLSQKCGPLLLQCPQSVSVVHLFSSCEMFALNALAFPFNYVQLHHPSPSFIHCPLDQSSSSSPRSSGQRWSPVRVSLRGEGLQSNYVIICGGDPLKSVAKSSLFIWFCMNVGN